MPKGTLYGVGVGPGDPKLMTLQAVDIITRCPVVAAPRTKGGGMVALDIAAGVANLEGKTILPLDFSMSHDTAVRDASHAAAAVLLRSELDAGSDVAMLNLGDVSIFASFQYMNEILAPEGYPVVMAPGIPSFCAAAAALGGSLTEMGTPLFIIPAGAALAEDPGRQAATHIYMKSGRALPELLGQLRDEGKLQKAVLVQNVGMENQRVAKDLENAEVASGYFSLVIVKG